MFCPPCPPSVVERGFDSYQLNPFFCCIGINVAIFHSARCTPAEFKVREGEGQGGQGREEGRFEAEIMSQPTSYPIAFGRLK